MLLMKFCESINRADGEDYYLLKNVLTKLLLHSYKINIFWYDVSLNTMTICSR